MTKKGKNDLSRSTHEGVSKALSPYFTGPAAGPRRRWMGQCSHATTWDFMPLAPQSCLALGLQGWPRATSGAHWEPDTAKKLSLSYPKLENPAEEDFAMDDFGWAISFEYKTLPFMLASLIFVFKLPLKGFSRIIIDRHFPRQGWEVVGGVLGMRKEA